MDIIIIIHTLSNMYEEVKRLRYWLSEREVVLSYICMLVDGHL